MKYLIKKSPLKTIIIFSVLNRVPKCDVIENEIYEIMGFVKLF